MAKSLKTARVLALLATTGLVLTASAVAQPKPTDWTVRAAIQLPALFAAGPDQRVQCRAGQAGLGL